MKKKIFIKSKWINIAIKNAIILFYLPVREADEDEVGDDDDGGSNKFADDEFLTMTPTVSKILALEMPVEAVELAFEAAATTGGVWLTNSRSLEKIILFVNFMDFSFK